MNHDNFTEVTSDDASLSYNNNEATAWANGYNACLDRTNAAELLDIAQLVVSSIDEYDFSKKYNQELLGLKQRAINAIKKATDESR